MKLKIFQVDAFTAKVFGGNPAAVCPLQEWLSDDLMQQIAAENNLSETAFFVQQGENYKIRWFTPETEVNLCGHATLASAHVLFNHLDYPASEIQFSSRSGKLLVRKEEELLVLDFPRAGFSKVNTPQQLTEALGKQALETWKGSNYMAVFGSEKEILEMKPDFAAMKKLDAEGVIVTSKGEIVDFVSRYFAPKLGINEDPVTGSAHTFLIPYWATQYNKAKLTALQLSSRKGEIIGRDLAGRVEILGSAVTYMEGEITI